MDCEARTDSLLQYALGTLDGPELDELRAHLKTGCPVCEGRLAQGHAMLAMLPLALTPVEPPAAARGRVLDRINDAKGADPGQADPSLKMSNVNRSRTSWWIPAMLGAAAAACVSILVYSNILSTERKTLQAVQGELSAKTKQLDHVQATAKDSQDLLHLIEAPSVKIVSMPGTALQPSGFARLIWDQDSRSLRVYASNLKPLPAGKGYELWLFNSGGPVPAGAFQVNGQGTGSLENQLSINPGQVIQVAITDEPYNGGKGLSKPSGQIQFLRGL